MTLGAALLPLASLGAPATVDMADTLDFETFHATDDWSIGIGHDGLVANRNPAPAATTPAEPLAAPPPLSPRRATGTLAQRETPRHSISNAYSLKPGKSRLSPVEATENLFRTMAETCPDGWQKDREWTTPTSGGFLLHYDFHCLDNPS